MGMGVGGATSTTSQDVVKVGLEFHSVLNWEKKKKKWGKKAGKEKEKKKEKKERYHGFSTVITGTLMNW